MRQTVETPDPFCAGTKAKHASHESNLFFRVLSRLQQPLDHVSIDRHRAPRHGSIQKYADQFGTFERVKLFLTEPHRLTAAQLPVAQIVQRLGDNGLIQGVWCGHDDPPLSRTVMGDRRSTRLNSSHY